MANNVEYVCARCEETDHDYGIGTPPLVLNCWNCGAGRGLEIVQMIQGKVGMFPTKKEDK